MYIYVYIYCLTWSRYCLLESAFISASVRGFFVELSSDIFLSPWTTKSLKKVKTTFLNEFLMIFINFLVIFPLTIFRKCSKLFNLLISKSSSALSRFN